MTSLIPLSLHPPFLLHNSHSFPSKPSSLSSSPSKLFLCFSSSSSPNSSNFDREEARWLREEQRWLREEQRWLREEQRWLTEKESLLRQISQLKLQIQALENQNSVQGASVSEMISNIGALLQVLKEKNRIAESGESAREMVLEEVKEKEVVVAEGVRVVERKEKEEEKKIERKALRVGSEGEQVREMQDALQKLGFYSGEEDMEFSCFSSGTERAVKTWQATVGAREDGIMTAELFQRLFGEQQIKSSASSSMADHEIAPFIIPEKEGTNGAAIASLTEISEIQQKAVKEEGFIETEVSQHRVFLLGENRWEEPSRLSGRDKQVRESKNKDTATKCHACRGEGRLLCTECDGTGEPNVEPQFLEWVDEGPNCPYCDGHGYTVCDVCQGKAVV
ncbi:protein disulfide isomerase pTAC5, chloroplastic [Durio zibethinus]|uniref:Protein disulfide isomerase pTAC5, chloroplastic n=1 Tax=Durio zibethinus TaxID=66656 RepID=A0A6P6AAQ7_DURZI|nr:protein disulfide isomerase pTAC5, chloroplastic [Durio zibethinus]